VTGLTYPVDALVSYHYYQSDTLMTAVTGPGHLRLIGDSGAFSAYAQGKTVKLADYAAWCTRWAGALTWVAALDVIGDPDATFANWAAFRDRWGIDSVPTIHAGADPALLDRYAECGVDFVGLGGLVGVAKRAFPWMVRVMRYGRDRHPGMRFHAWGVTNRKILDVLPVYSADSSGIMGQGYRYGRIRLFDPDTHRDITVHLDGGPDAYRHGRLLRRVYGTDPAAIAKAQPSNRAALGRLAVAATQQYAAWLQARHGVTPPSWGIAEAAGDGTRVHVVSSHKDAYDPLAPKPGPTLHCAEQYADLTVLAPPDGTRLHVTTTSTGALDTDLLPPGGRGPRLHVVDTDPGQLKGIAPP
jgi:hypothetical protein